jgi:uncharacterized membrane protein YqiK
MNRSILLMRAKAAASRKRAKAAASRRRRTSPAWAMTLAVFGAGALQVGERVVVLVKQLENLTVERRDALG